MAQSAGDGVPLHIQEMVGLPEMVHTVEMGLGHGTEHHLDQATRSERARVLVPNCAEGSVREELLILELGPNEDCARDHCA